MSSLLDINFYKLNVYCKAVEKKSITLAAQELYISQPAASMHIKDLEEYFGITLLQREKRSVTPTQAGEVVYCFARQTLNSLDEVNRTITEFRGAKAGRIVMAAAMSIGSYKLTEALCQFKQSYPAADLVLIVASTAQVYDLILRGEADIGITLCCGYPPKGIVAQEAYEEEIVLAASPQNPLASTEGPVTVEQMATQPFVCAIKGSPYSEMMETKLRELGMNTYQVAVEFGDIEAMKRAVEVDLGLSLFFHNSVAQELRTGQLRRLLLEHPLTGKFSFAYRANKHFPPVLSALLDFLRQYLKSTTT